MSSVFQKRYLAVGPDAVLTTSRKDTSANRLYPGLPSSPSKPPHGAVSPKRTPRKTPAAGPLAALPPVPSASAAPSGSSAAVLSTVPVSAAVPVTIPAAGSETPAAQANIRTSIVTGAAAGDGAVVKKKRVAIAADSPVRPSSASEEQGADSAGLLDAAHADVQGAPGSGTAKHAARGCFDNKSAHQACCTKHQIAIRSIQAQVMLPSLHMVGALLVLWQGVMTISQYPCGKCEFNRCKHLASPIPPIPPIADQICIVSPVLVSRQLPADSCSDLQFAVLILFYPLRMLCCAMPRLCKTLLSLHCPFKVMMQLRSLGGVITAGNEVWMLWANCKGTLVHLMLTASLHSS